MLFLLKEAFQCRTTWNPFLQMECYHNVTILASSLALDNDIITIVDMILNHRASTNNQSVSILCINDARSHIHRLESICVDIERLTSSNIALHRDALLASRRSEFDPTALLG